MLIITLSAEQIQHAHYPKINSNCKRNGQFVSKSFKFITYYVFGVHLRQICLFTEVNIHHQGKGENAGLDPDEYEF